MAHQSPMISIPKKTTDDVDWTTPIRNVIAQSYGENPDNYAAECAGLQRCRQDAVKGAGSDFTARDLLYKYFGQLELLELRFPEIRVNFPWRDAFTNKLITQTSIAYEKASVLFQIASTHSAIAAAQSRSDPEGLKRAFYYFRTTAGMLNYINENFLHAPSTDLSRDVVKFLADVILAQATEVFFEKCTDEKKGNALMSKIATQAAFLYTTLTDDVKEFMGKGIFDRNWVTIIQIKAKYFQSLAQYHRGLADDAAGKHGDALVRFNLAEPLAKEASKIAQSFASMFVGTMSPNLPADCGTSISERTKANHAVCSDKKAEAQRENDMIYNAVLPSPDALPSMERTAVATPIHIHDVYAAPDVQKTIGQDFFIKLVPLSVHESASVYSEEKAKLVRAEVERADAAEGESRSIVDGMGIREGLTRFRAMADGEVGGEEEVPLEVRRWKEDISLVEEREGVQGLLVQLAQSKENVRKDLDIVGRDLENESRECEMMRVKFEHLWTQDPSAALTKTMRQDLKSHLSSLEAAAASDQQVQTLWESVRGDIHLLLGPEVETLFKERGGSGANNLLDLDVGSEQDDARERKKIRGFVDEIEERLTRLHKISKERNEVMKDLKEKVQGDDVSHLLLLNRRNTGVEPTLFATELEKFKPYQQRLTSTVLAQEAVLQELSTLWKGIKDLAGKGPGARKWEDREKRKKDTVRRFSRARDGYMEVRDGIAKGLQFYSELSKMTKELQSHVRSFTIRRGTERETLAAKLETERRLSAITSSSPPPKPPPPPTKSTLDSALAELSLRDAQSSHQSTPSWQNKPPPPPPGQAQSSYHYTSPPQQQHPYPPPVPQHQPQHHQLPSAPQYPPQHQQQHQYEPSRQSQFSPPPPPHQQSQQYPGYQPQFHQPPPQGYGASPPPGQHQNYSLPPPPTLQPYSGSSFSSPPPPPQSTSSSFLPPPPPRPVQTSLGSNNTPQSDPYASLTLLGSQSFNAPTQAPGQGSNNSSTFSPPPPSQQQQNYGYSYGQPPPQPPPQRQGSFGTPGLPPPPPPQQQQQYSGSGYGSAPLPPPQQQYQQQPQGGHGGYQQGYGGYGYGQ